ncbi:protein-disulfide reductase DsbD [Xanthobacter autotrophicus DSM 431]|uniref:protein-disulfide reductase DsbD n=1 Tax=Xanthobacter nonsaccharivorans TaxID=3119912 RepID=UPI00372B3890
MTSPPPRAATMPLRGPLGSAPGRHPALLMALLLALLAPAAATAGAPQPLKADEAFRLAAARTADGTLTLSWQIAPGTYLYRDSLKAELAGTPVALATPAGEAKDDPNFGPVDVYHHATQATAPGLPAGGGLEVSFQGCAEAGICYPVVTRRVDLASLKVEMPGPGPAAALRAASSPPPGGDAASSAPQGGGASMPFGPARRDAAAPASAGDGAAAVPAPSDAAASQTGAALFDASLRALLAAFLGFGLVLAFTPCVFPMLPILSGILAGGGVRPTPGRGFALSAAYGLAMAAAYGVLGVAAGWSGANLQAAVQTPLALGLLAAVFVALALSMFGLFELALPAALGARLPRLGNGSLAGAAGLGFASALVVGPCVTPPLAAAMLYAAQTGDAARGGAALFMLGLGMSLPLVLVGTFGAQALPRSGPWLLRIRQACGVVFLAVAALLAARLLPGPAGVALWGALAMGLGVFLGALERAGRAPAARLAKAAGLVALVYGGALVVGAAAGADDPLRPLAGLAEAPRAMPAAPEVRVATPAALEAAVAAATAGGRPVLVSFTAGWCTVCRSNEQVMADPALAPRLARLPRVTADVTDYGEGARALMARFSVVGPPTLFLMDGAGRERDGSRRIGALTPADLDRLMAEAGL